jgi:hypothetical protein
MLVNLSTSSAAIGQIMNIRKILLGTDEDDDDEEEDDDDDEDGVGVGVVAGGGAEGTDEDGKVG